MLVFISIFGMGVSIYADVNENEIPIKIDTLKVQSLSESGDSYRYYVSYLIVGLIFILGFYFIKRRSTYFAHTNGMPKIKILDQHYLGPKKSLAIVNVSGESILIGITDQNINLIKSLSLIDDEVKDNPVPILFQSALTDSEEKDFVQKDINEVGQYIGLSRSRNKIL